MRQVFSSGRLENVEGVAKLLREAGIEIKVTGQRGYRQVSRREFSYVGKQREDAEQPAVLVVNSGDYKRARELLHEAGLIEASATPSSYLPESLQPKESAPASPQQRIFRIKVVLLVVLGGFVLLSLVRFFLAR
jgi:hypothetical protein